MAAPVPTSEPTRFSAGDTLLFTRSLADYPADVWTLNYKIVNGLHAYGFTATADGTSYSVNVPKSSTEEWAAGSYELNGYVTGVVDSQDERHTVYTGLLTILPNKAATQPIEFRSWAQQALAAIESAIILDAGRGGMLEYSINGRSFRYSFEQATKLRDYLLGQVNLANGGGSQRKILTRFRSPRGSYTAPFV